MRIAVSGASGLLGAALVPALRADGHDVLRLVRGAAKSPSEIAWDPAAGKIDSARLDGADAVVHLAGESLAAKRWTEARKRRIRDSRVGGTRLVADAIARLPSRPRVLVCASAVGWYGSRGDEQVDETAAPGTGFLAEVCGAWEQAADPARQAGIRVVNLRYGVILSPDGGALPRMARPFSLGLGGRLGTGRQWLSWVSIDDAVGATKFALAADALSGPANAVSPNPVTNAEYTLALGLALRRPTPSPMPSFVARILFGEMADALLLNGQRVIPARLAALGYRFVHPALAPALEALFARPRPSR